MVEKPFHEMTDGEWRLHVSHRLESIEKYQRRQTQIWWGVAGTIGLFVGQRFLGWVIESGILAGMPT